ncbi:queuosine precursor transporter [Paracoccus sp. IB05]|uniref:queuosine precursor transporter n=1 Tax=Paracoccus sp. IB05 TaxID=2779367 RepID=UPI0018E72AB1|nr:queuosine precursor transporter [Paracoccus sp. IB05]MBJ2152498.1 queuosine precursor transporter [Paracoccus sp. IB05]
MIRLLPGILAMAAIVLASNILVQFPFGDFLTWGAFTYPFAFLVGDLVNRFQGPRAARIVVLAGFLTGLICSLIGTQIMGEFGPLVTLRIAIGSGLAYLVAQMVDVSIFTALRNQSWWKAPLISSLISSSIDTVIFFSIAFAAFFTFLDPGVDVSWAAAPGPLLGFGSAVPFWVSLAIGDWCVKIALALVALVPFRIIIGKVTARFA